MRPGLSSTAANSASLSHDNGVDALSEVNVTRILHFARSRTTSCLAENKPHNVALLDVTHLGEMAQAL